MREDGSRLKVGGDLRGDYLPRDIRVAGRFDLVAQAAFKVLPLLLEQGVGRVFSRQFAGTLQSPRGIARTPRLCTGRLAPVR